MTKQDKEYLLTSMENLLDRKLQPIISVNHEQTLQLQRHEQALFGVNGNNGLNGKVKKLEKVYMWVSGGVTAIALGGQYLIQKIMKG